jgi:sugar phosphate isomerase/epimerase
MQGETTIMGMLGVIHYNAPGATLEEFLAWASGAGFESTELQIRDLWPDESVCWKESAEEGKRLVEKYGLVVSAIASGNDFVYLDAENIDKQAARMKTICDIAQFMGCKVIRTEGGQPKDAVPEDKWVEAMATSIRACLPFVKEMGMKFAIDNHGYVTNHIPTMLGLLREVDEPEFVGSNLDTMNVRWFGNSLEECDQFYREVAPWVMHTHMKDGFGSRAEYKGKDLGNGEINLKLAVEVLKEAGYDYAWTAEYEGKEGDGVGYEKCLVWLRHNI